MAEAALWLFDIDGTLLDTAGAGMSALREAAATLFGSDGPPLDLAGATDLGVVAEIFDHHGAEPTESAVSVFFRDLSRPSPAESAGCEISAEIAAGC